MKNNYLFMFLAAMGLGQQAWGQATAWRPFRPNLVYHFQNSTADSLYTLKVDSAYAVGPDSVFAFNRVLRQVPGGQLVKSRNNLFGARLVVSPANEFVLEVQAEAGSTAYPTVPPLLAQSIKLKPRAAVGSSWAASAGTTATLTSRTVRVINGQSDSVAVVTLSDGRVVELSRRYGLVAAPRLLGAGAGRQLQLHQLPQPQALYTLPASIYDFQPGDEFGYTDRSQITATAACTAYLSLSRIVSRQQTADSLIYTQYSQSAKIENDLPHCPSPLTVTYSATALRRSAYALRPTPNGSYNTAGLLTYGYQQVSTSSLVVVLPTSSSSTCGATRYATPSLLLVRLANSAAFVPLSDYPIISRLLTGLGNVQSGSNALTYSYKHLAGNALTCGSSQPYATLLPTRAAQAAQVATLHPNPATTLATLTLAAAAPAGTTLTLTNALGRQCWSQPVAAGQTTLAVPVAGLPTGLYLVQLALPGQPALTWKLTTD